ncbi:MAG: coproporphyrinogen dehydrogenase HemZ [Eubacteriales bacterium]|nr:coproporphyrinogen dehydrogenase HemZ [Eubacteriales bacterium]
MKLKTEGGIKPYFVQTLCMLFFPGEKFSGGERRTGEPELYLREEENAEGITCHVTVTAEGKTEYETCTEPFRNGYTADQTAKIAAGKAVYRACGRLLGYRPPWGTLTGVRPSKLAMGLLRQDMDAGASIKKLTDDYLVSADKASLALSVAQTEIDVIDTHLTGACSLYISVPFCPSRCAYCSFVSYSTPRLLSLIPDYLTRLCGDIDRMFEVIGPEARIVSVYIGGGTPTVLTEAQLALLLGRIDKNLKKRKGLLEYTLEAGRPDTITTEKLIIARSFGVTRVSVNPQTLDDGVLRRIGRGHTAQDFLRAYDIARESGIKYINTDLIAGLPGDSFEVFAQSLDSIAALSPENITVHTFCVKKSADMQAPDLLGGDTAQQSVDYARLKTGEAGYIPYYVYRQKNSAGNLENTGYALPSCEGLYNIAIMEEIHSIFAVGAGSVTKIVRGASKIQRLFMPKYPYEYLNMNETDIGAFFAETARLIKDF